MQNENILRKEYELWEAAWKSSDLLECAEHLSVFAKTALESEFRTMLKKLLNRDMSTALYLIAPYFAVGSKDSYYLNIGNRALQVYLYLHIAHSLPPVKLFNNILEVATNIKDAFLPPSGKCVSDTFIKDAVTFLNDRFNFFDKVYGEKPIFNLLSNSNVGYNSICVTRDNVQGITKYFVFLYNMKHDVKDQISPQYVFLHELGHALQAKLTGSIYIPHESFKSYFKAVSPGTDIPDLELCELFADTFAMAAMYNNQFSCYDPFAEIDSEMKSMFLDYIDKLMNLL